MEKENKMFNFGYREGALAIKHNLAGWWTIASKSREEWEKDHFSKDFIKGYLKGEESEKKLRGVK